MKYYPHHIGDFDRATRHLTRVERSIYRDLIEVYYDTEQPLTLDLNALCRKVLARSDDERTAVEQALNEFFTKTERGWYHDRCEEVIEEYRNSTSQKSAAGKASAAKRALKREQALNGNPTTVETPVEQPNHGTPPNQEPRTNNQKPEKKTKAPPPALPDWMPLDSWNGYIEMRKKQKKPPTERAVVLLIGVLGKMRDAGHDIAAILDTSTKNCWTDVYLPKDGARQAVGNKFDLRGKDYSKDAALVEATRRRVEEAGYAGSSDLEF